MLASDLTRTADETSRHARVWTERVGARVKRSTFFAGHADWVHDTSIERKDEELWRTEAGLNVPQLTHTSAPDDFTSGVMARIAAQQAPRLASTVTFSGPTVEPVRMLAGTVGISAMIALASSCILAILAPSQALALIGWVIGAGMIVLLALREILGIVTSLLASSGVLIILGTLAVLTLMTVLRFARSEDRVIHEA
jgi:hypothetical protein